MAAHPTRSQPPCPGSPSSLEPLAAAAAMPFVRLRQIALNASDIDWASDTLCQALDTTVAYRDPHILGIGARSSALAQLSVTRLKQLRALRSELFNVLLYCGDCMLEIVSPTDAGYEAAPGGLGGRGPNTQAKLLQKQGDSGYMAIFQVEDLVGVSRRLADQNVRDVSNNGMYTETAVGDGGAVHTMRYRTHDPAPLATDSARTTLTGVQWHPADCGTLLETDQAEPNLPGAVRTSLALPAALNLRLSQPPFGSGRLLDACGQRLAERPRAQVDRVRGVRRRNDRGGRARRDGQEVRRRLRQAPRRRPRRPSHRRPDRRPQRPARRAAACQVHPSGPGLGRRPQRRGRRRSLRRGRRRRRRLANAQQEGLR